MSQSSLYFDNRTKMFATYGTTANIVRRYTLPGSELTTDVFYFGRITKGKNPRPADKHVVVVISGTHGLEGPIGSHVQLQLAERIYALRDSNVGVLLIHALNPYGYRYNRRVDAKNIDVNRAGGTEFVTHSAYADVQSLVEPAAWSAIAEQAIREKLSNVNTARSFQAAVMGGQYDFAQGLFYGGGNGECWSVGVLQKIMGELFLEQSFWRETKRMFIIDIHTGLGAYGQGEIYSPAPANDNVLAIRTKEWLGRLGNQVRFPLASDKKSSSAPIAGDILSALIRFLPTRDVMPIAVEIGTTMATADLIAWSAAENWIHHHPNQLSIGEEQNIRDCLNDGFFPRDDSKWLNLAWERCADIFDVCVPGMINGQEYTSPMAFMPRSPWS